MAPATRRNSTSAPGNTGFKVWPGPHSSTLGVGVCWDQWYPETARAMTLMGADILFYPTAIGTEPHDPDLDTSRLWRRAMIGHAVSNVVPVVAANRIGTEDGQRFYGSSFICDERGDILAELGARKQVRSSQRSTSPQRRSTAPPSASSGTAGPSFTDGWWRTFDQLTCAAAACRRRLFVCRDTELLDRFPSLFGHRDLKRILAANETAPTCELLPRCVPGGRQTAPGGILQRAAAQISEKLDHRFAMRQE